MIEKKYKKILFFLVFILAPTLTSAASTTYTPYENIPGFTTTGDFYEYITAIYKFGLWAVGIAALFMIVWGGYMYIASAGNSSKAGTAKQVITDAIIGLLLALFSYLLLYLINPDLVKPRKLSEISSEVSGTTTTSASGQEGSCNGFSLQSGLSSSQCQYVSSELASVLSCLQSKGITAEITSISDNAGFERCVTDYQKPPCSHSKTSCHYGGGKNTSECSKSFAADISTRSGQGSEIEKAAKECGARVNPEYETNHIHVSAQTNCCNL